MARSITTRRPLWVQEVDFGDGTTGFATDGTPVDCVRLAHLGLIDDWSSGDGRLRHQPRHEHRRRHHLLGHGRRGARGDRARPARDRRLAAVECARARLPSGRRRSTSTPQPTSRRGSSAISRACRCRRDAAQRQLSRLPARGHRGRATGQALLQRRARAGRSRIRAFPTRRLYRVYGEEATGDEEERDTDITAVASAACGDHAAALRSHPPRRRAGADRARPASVCWRSRSNEQP